MNRGSLVPLSGVSVPLSGFNEAPIHESGKLDFVQMRHGAHFVLQ